MNRGSVAAFLIVACASAGVGYLANSANGPRSASARLLPQPTPEPVAWLDPGPVLADADAWDAGEYRWLDNRHVCFFTRGAAGTGARLKAWKLDVVSRTSVPLPLGMPAPAGGDGSRPQLGRSAAVSPDGTRLATARLTAGSLLSADLFGAGSQPLAHWKVRLPFQPDDSVSPQARARVEWLTDGPRWSLCLSVRDGQRRPWLVRALFGTQAASPPRVDSWLLRGSMVAGGYRVWGDAAAMPDGTVRLSPAPLDGSQIERFYTFVPSVAVPANEVMCQATRRGGTFQVAHAQNGAVTAWVDCDFDYQAKPNGGSKARIQEYVFRASRADGSRLTCLGAIKPSRQPSTEDVPSLHAQLSPDGRRLGFIYDGGFHVVPMPAL